MESKIKDAVVRYLKIKEYEILDEDFCNVIVARNNRGLVFISWGSATVPDDKDILISREDFEQIMIDWLKENEPSDTNIEYDTVVVIPFSDNKALIKHHVNAEPKDKWF